MVVAAVIITDATFAGEGRHGFVGHGSERGGRKDQGLKAVQRTPKVARSHLGDLLKHFFRSLDAERAQTSFLICERRAQERGDLERRQRVESEKMTATQESWDDVEAGVVGRAADEAHYARFDVRQQQVLLRLVEAMDLIDHQDRLT